MNILQQLRIVAAETPNAIALRYEAQTLHFETLLKRMDGLATLLHENNIGHGDHVGIAFPRSIEMIIAILGTMAAGATWVPLDPANPVSRLTTIIEDAKLSVLLTDEAGISLGNNAALPCLLPSEWPQEGKPVHTEPAEICYLIYTSGSTGKPKGVAIGAASLENYLQWALSELPFKGGGVPLITSISFDHAITNLFPPLLKGECLILCAPIEGGRMLAQALLPKHAHSFTPYSYVKITPSLFSFLDKEQRALLGCSTHLLMFGGEKCIPAHIADARKYNPSLVVMNHYGPTEATVGCCTYRIPAAFEGSSVPVGKPIPGVNTSIRRPDFSLAATEETGELFIGGAALANGYWEQPVLTEKMFPYLPDEQGRPQRWYRTGDQASINAAGTIEILGRTDDQIKILGNRIEPAEIIALLNTFPGVRQSTVFAIEHAGNKELIAAIAFYQQPPEPEQIRKYLLAGLPPAMVPARYILTNQLPVGASGKADIKQLSAMVPALKQELSVPESVAEKFREILCVEQINPEDDYFLLGGDSLGTVEIATWAASQYNIPLDIACLFSYPTVETLSAHIHELMSDPST